MLFACTALFFWSGQEINAVFLFNFRVEHFSDQAIVLLQNEALSCIVLNLMFYIYSIARYVLHARYIKGVRIFVIHIFITET